MDDVYCSRCRCLSGHASPLIETARTGVAEVAGTEEPPEAFWNGIEQLGHAGCFGLDRIDLQKVQAHRPAA